jgi:hypothetical protein
VATALEREAVLLDLQTKYFYSVNSSGWAITQLFESGSTHAEALRRAREWGASNGDIDAVNAFIGRLVSEKLVEPATAASSDDVEVTFEGEWHAPTVDKHKEPLQRVMISAFDPTLPLAE